MTVPDWDGVAKYLLEKERLIKPLNSPEPAGALIKWRGDIYFGTVQAIAEPSGEIFVISKTSGFVPPGMVEAIRKLDPGRLELTADDNLDLTGRSHVLRKVDKRLTCMTPGQIEYMLRHPLMIHEI